MTKKTVVDFVENGIHYHAERGFAFAEKDGETVWRAIDVYTKSPPTKEAVLGLDKIFKKLDEIGDEDLDDE